MQGGSYLLLEINSDSLIEEKIQSKVIPIKLLKENNLVYSNFNIKNKSFSPTSVMLINLNYFSFLKKTI